MANNKLSALVALAEAPADTDLFSVLDVSDTTMSGTGTNKKITGSNLFANLAPRALSTITVDAGADGSTPRPTGWGHVQWIKNNGVVLANLGANDFVFERLA